MSGISHISWAIAFWAVMFAGQPVERPNDGIAASLPDQPGPITQKTVADYWSKRVSELTINQISVEQCPEINLVVSLLDDEGNPIVGLTSNEFVLREDGVERAVNVRPITSGVGADISLAICIDISGSLSSTDLRNEKDAAIQLVNLLGPRDQVEVYSFGTGVRLEQAFTSDKTAAIAAINAISRGGSTSLYDGVYTALTSTAQQSGRKAVVVMTDGLDNSSSRDEQDVIDLATTSNIPVFSIGFGNASATILERIANQTGGIFFPSANSQDLIAILDKIGNILSQQYIVTFTTGFPDGGTHRVEVDVNAGGQVLSNSRSYSGCLYEPIPDAPTFVDDTNFYIDGNGYLICIFPDPNSDGSNLDGQANYGYVVYFLVDCQIVGGPFVISLSNATGAWPQVVSLDPGNLPTQPFVIRVARVYEGSSAGAGPSIDIAAPTAGPATVPTSYRNYDRWLLHLPREAGGYRGLLRFLNPNPVATQIRLAGFDTQGNLLKIEEIDVAERDIVYRDLYQGDLFAEFQDVISHIGIFETARLASVALQYRSTASGYGSWVQEVSLRDGLATGNVLELEGGSDARYTDGVVVLNLSNSQSIQPWVVQRNRITGALVLEAQMDAIPPGGKRGLVLSDLFPFQPDTVYSFETRDTRLTLQALGLSFSGADFFAPIPVIRP